MNASERFISLGFTPETFPAGTHMCYIYSDDAERAGVISAFVESGLQQSEKVGYLADVADPAEIDSHLVRLGIDARRAGVGGQLWVAQALNTYCPEGTFIPEHMLQELRAIYEKGIEEGYVGARVSGEMSWALRGLPVRIDYLNMRSL